MAKNKDAEIFETEKTAEVSYPHRGPNTEAKIASWKQQRRTKCCHKKCFYPLNLDTEPNTRALVHVSSPEGEAAFRATCAWDPKHVRPDGEPQFILASSMKPFEEE